MSKLPRKNVMNMVLVICGKKAYRLSNWSGNIHRTPLQPAPIIRTLPLVEKVPPKKLSDYEHQRFGLFGNLDRSLTLA
jgi:hypothetical protein